MRVQAAKGQSSHLQWNHPNIIISTYLNLIQNLKNLRIITIHPLWNIFGCNTKNDFERLKIECSQFSFWLHYWQILWLQINGLFASILPWFILPLIRKFLYDGTLEFNEYDIYDLNIHAKIVINVLINDNYLIQSTYNQLQTSTIILLFHNKKIGGP
jgi:hypothetical protein